MEGGTPEEKEDNEIMNESNHNEKKKKHKKTNFKYKIKKTKIPKKKKKKTLEITSYNTTIPFHTYTHTNHIPKSYS